jgi:addiction module RelE/StbE family toxin
MNIVYDPAFMEKLKKADVRIRKSFKEKIILFSQNPHSPQLNNHPLKREYKGYRSINITADLRAVYKEIEEGEEMIVYFILFGTHNELYR